MTAAPLTGRQRIALAVEYDGSGFLGWQRLSHGPTVEGVLEAAVARVANEAVDIQGCGRTDAGVHAINQIVHFDTTAVRPMRGWILGCNSNLPSSVVVTWAGIVPPEFHARFWARRRRYRYIILNRAVRPALGAGYLTWERRPLDAGRMHEAAQALIGEHDFSAFRAAACQARHARRRMHEVGVRREGDRVVVEVEANAFLHHMVRNIVGALLPIGRGDRDPGWVAELLAGRTRIREVVTAPPDGLTFLGPRYPRGLGLPGWLECDDPL
ncbi:tRNA pseudouridine38-40 synthase [Pseudofulvimonas gallinarii]|uniref:tRNA pseudouridine synthase A n=1 Tax=Pseudofulvimonas gallinarii TaxID=634155 RepID=A0A4R3L9L1_9GAMM|nr:tRNA pseudouridine38-40 synthase [Pseudofulvimonas gallinarii]